MIVKEFIAYNGSSSEHMAFLVAKSKALLVEGPILFEGISS